MKILLDNCVHCDASRLFGSGHQVVHARDADWRRLSNGTLILAASRADFDVLATTDKKIRREHDLGKLPIALLELNSPFTLISDLQTLQPHLPRALELCRAYRFVSVKPDGTFECIAAWSTSQC